MQLSTYLSFNGDCRQAFEFYQATLGGTIHALMPFGESPGCETLGADDREKIMHGCYELDGFMLMATDANAMYPYTGVNGAHVALSLSDADAARRIFDALSDRGNVQMPLQETFWAKAYGIVTDRFGVPWMINCVEEMGCVDKDQAA
ncbi:MAG: VOC family protein [Lysobacter sp.]